MVALILVPRFNRLCFLTIGFSLTLLIKGSNITSINKATENSRNVKICQKTRSKTCSQFNQTSQHQQTWSICALWHGIYQWRSGIFDRMGVSAKLQGSLFVHESNL